ncbi:MAG: hypothetical protein JKY99_12700 [Rhizobiales bacterium]|nr:hypothetical protein [Hyphomicrobiales bacterium]
MTQFRKKGQVDIYEPVPAKPKKKFDWDGLFGAIFLIFIAVAVLSNL